MKQVSLHKALEAKGWTWEGDSLYPPNRTGPSTSGSEYLPLSMIEQMYEKHKSILEMERQRKNAFPDKEQLRCWTEDMQSLVDTLKELLDK